MRIFIRVIAFFCALTAVSPAQNDVEAEAQLLTTLHQMYAAEKKHDLCHRQFPVPPNVVRPTVKMAQTGYSPLAKIGLTSNLISAARWRGGPPLNTSKVRVLIVEDFEPFRQFLCSTLKNRPECQVIGEVSNGVEAVRRSEELKPDVILMDIGLPELNGIEAARRICKVSPESKIVFVSEEHARNVAEEALCAGAVGYVVKSHATRELLRALEGVLQGRRFMSAGLNGRS